MTTFLQDLQATAHNAETLLEGKSSFSQFISEEGALITAKIAEAPAVAQGALTLGYNSLKDGLSTLVGIGETAIGPLISQSSDTQATMLVNLMQAAGIPTVGPLSLAEHAVFVSLINGLKAGLDRVGLHLVLNNGVTVPTTAKSAGTIIQGTVTQPQ